MKGVMLLISLLFLVSFVSALPTINLYSTTFQPGETVVGNITGVSQTLSASDLKFFEGRREVSFEKNLVTYGEGYYFSVIFNREGNFSLQLDNLFYRENGVLKSINLNENFEVKMKNNSQILTIRPGVVFTTGEFNLSLTNGGNESLNFSYGKNNKSSLNVGENEKITILPTENLSLFEIKSYKTFFVPIIYLEIKNETPVNFSQEKFISLRASPKSVELQKFQGEKISYNVELFNFAEDNLTDIMVKSKLDFLKFGNIETMAGKTSVNFSIEGTPKNTGLFQDNISITYLENKTNEQLLIPLTVYIFPVNATQEEIAKSLTCFDVGGKGSCGADEKCTGNLSKTIENCCIGLCEKVDSGNSTGIVIGVLIVVFLGVVGFAVWKKFKNVKPKNKLISS